MTPELFHNYNMTQICNRRHGPVSHHITWAKGTLKLVISSWFFGLDFGWHESCHLPTVVRIYRFLYDRGSAPTPHPASAASTLMSVMKVSAGYQNGPEVKLCSLLLLLTSRWFDFCVYFRSDLRTRGWKQPLKNVVLVESWMFCSVNMWQVSRISPV